MPFALSFIGGTLIVVGFQNTYKQLGSLLVGDFTGSNNFIYWLAALGIVGAIGYYKPLEPITRLLMLLIAAVVFLSKGQTGGFFQQFTTALGSGSTTENTGIGQPLAGTGGSGAATSGGSGGTTGVLQSLAVPAFTDSFDAGSAFDSVGSIASAFGL